MSNYLLIRMSSLTFVNIIKEIIIMRLPSLAFMIVNMEINVTRMLSSIFMNLKSQLKLLSKRLDSDKKIMITNHLIANSFEKSEGIKILE